ncbi:MAG TPA: hypothetical protein VNR38_05110 [Ureibacillus sp.]|nr:hypothetical protein [Ureibacillus sp.]
MQYYFNPQVSYLLITRSREKVAVHYGTTNFKLPEIGPRPPYFTNPRYEPYYPVI